MERKCSKRPRTARVKGEICGKKFPDIILKNRTPLFSFSKTSKIGSECVIGGRGTQKGRQKGHLSMEAERQHGSSMTSKQNRGGPASPRQSPWLHRNTRAMPTLQTHSLPHSSATLHYPVFIQARRGSAPLSLHYSVPAHRQTNKEALLRLQQGVCCPSGIRSHSMQNIKRKLASYIYTYWDIVLHNRRFSPFVDLRRVSLP